MQGGKAAPFGPHRARARCFTTRPGKASVPVSTNCRFDRIHWPIDNCAPTSSSDRALASNAVRRAIDLKLKPVIAVWVAFACGQEKQRGRLNTAQDCNDKGSEAWA